MHHIFVNLKRFDVSKRLGGLCPLDDPVAWIESVMRDTVEYGLGRQENLALAYLLPEGLVSPALRALKGFPDAMTHRLQIGCQGVHWEDVTPGGNFGAFTTGLPAAAAANLGCTWSIVGHSEERRFKLQVMQAFEPAIATDGVLQSRAGRSVDTLVNAEVLCALSAGLSVLLCVGESAEERGDGSFEEQKPRIGRSLEAQVVTGLRGVVDRLQNKRLVIGYEPIWAIGPGRVPPGEAYISFVSAFIKQTVETYYGLDPIVVYGGGLKEENAGMIAGIPTIRGGLVGLTRFTGDIGFDVAGLKRIVGRYLSGLPGGKP
jgi:triosephosphate isomerase